MQNALARCGIARGYLQWRDTIGKSIAAGFSFVIGISARVRVRR